MNASDTRSAWWVLIFIFSFVAIINIAQFLDLFGTTQFVDKPKESLRAIDSSVRTFFSRSITGISTEDPLKEIREEANALRKLFKTPLEGEARRRLAMLEHEFKLGDPLQTLRPLANAKDPLSGEALKRNANAWMKLYGSIPPQPQEVPALMKEIRSSSLGWWVKLAEKHAYARAGDKQRSEQLQQQINSEAMTFTWSLLGVLCMVAIAVLIGLVVWIAVALFKGWRLLPSRPLPHLHPESLDGSLWSVNLFFITILCVGQTGLRPDQPLLMELTSLAIAVFVLTSLHLWSIKTGIALRLLGLQLQKPFRDIISGFLAFCAYLVPLIPLLILIHFLSPALPEQTNPLADKVISDLSLWEKISLFLQAAVFAPFIEEIVFRGILFSVLWQRTGRIWLSALASGFLFAVIHPQFLGGLLAITLLGTMMALLYAYTRSLLPCMIVHALNNGAITLLMLFTQEDVGF